jgi:hypothetical protein
VSVVFVDPRVSGFRGRGAGGGGWKLGRGGERAEEDVALPGWVTRLSIIETWRGGRHHETTVRLAGVKRCFEWWASYITCVKGSPHLKIGDYRDEETAARAYTLASLIYQTADVLKIQGLPDGRWPFMTPGVGVCLCL